MIEVKKVGRMEEEIPILFSSETFIKVEKKRKKKPQIKKGKEKVNKPVVAKPMIEKGRNKISRNRYNYSWPFNKIFWVRSKLDQFSDPEGFIKFLASQGYSTENWLALRDSLKIGLANNIVLLETIKFKVLKYSCWSRSRVGPVIIIEKLLVNLRKFEDFNKQCKKVF